MTDTRRTPCVEAHGANGSNRCPADLHNFKDY